MANSYPSDSPGVPDVSMPTGAPGFGARRSSYASVVSGTAPANGQQYQQPARSGAFSLLLNHNTEFAYESNGHGQGGHMRYDLPAYEMDFGANETFHGRSGSWGRKGSQPGLSSAYWSIMNGNGYGSYGGSYADNFFVPSYLRGSKYVQNLEEGHRAKVLAHKDGPSAHSSQPASLSTSAGSTHLHAKIAPSHRGMAYDLIEKAPPVEDQALAPLPSRWNNQDKFGGLEAMSEGQEVKFTGPKPDRDREHEACAIRADFPMPPQCGIYYYEVTIISRKREESSIGIGFSSQAVSLSRLPGWEPESWAYHGDDGHSFGCQSTGKNYGPPFTTGDVIGCGVNFRTGSAFFTKNGDFLGIAFREIKGRLFPSVGMKRSGEHIRANFGQCPFVFDIDGMMEAEKMNIKQEIEETSTEMISTRHSETQLIQALVLQFLTHDGYIESARAFAEEVYSENKALTLAPDAVVPGFHVNEHEDACHRQRIRAAILEGDVEKALKYTHAFYPRVLKEDKKFSQVYFRLRCRKFIEMIRQAAEMLNSNSKHSKKGHMNIGDWYDDIINRDMDLDDNHSQANNWDRMETEEVPENQAEYQRLVADTIAYGQDLQAEFKDDSREVSKALEDAFSLIAYQNPLNSKEVSHLLDPNGRVAVSEELNAAILQSLNRPPSAALEQLYQQTSVLLEVLREGGGSGAFVNIDDFVRP